MSEVSQANSAGTRPGGDPAQRPGGKRIGAVVLFNLGGPDSPTAIAPFLFNLFNDPAIIALPGLLRWLVAKLIARRRAPVAAGIYAHMGGASPLLAQTEDQARALRLRLNADDEETSWDVFIAMRYWHPMSDEVARAVAAYGPDEVVLLPLYPQFSTTTTGSSVTDWMAAAARAGLVAPHRAICCYPDEAGLIAAHVDVLRAALAAAGAAAEGALVRVLFSAHGLPKKVIAGGDPYQAQVNRTAAAVAGALDRDGLDWRACYQSRVGPLDWIGPSTIDEIKRAGADGVALVVVPIAFVSDHSETLVELDIEYADLARDHGVPVYTRVAVVGTAEPFIAGLARLIGARGAIDPDRAGACATGHVDPAEPMCVGFAKCISGRMIKP